MGLREKLEAKGFNPANIAWAIGYIIVFDFTYTAGLVGFCYMTNPTHFIIHKLPFAGPKKKLSSLLEKPKNWKFLSMIPEGKRAAATISVCEMLVLKTVLKPLALPAIFWASYKLTIN